MQTKPKEAFIDLYYEDVVVGDVVLTDSHTITMEDVLGFGRVTRDMHPLHTDPDYCLDTAFGRPIAHGLYGLSLIEGLKSELKLYENTSIASLGWDKVKFRAPLYPGDTVHVKVTFESKRESRSGHGILIERTEMINQDGIVVIDAEHAAMVRRRGGAS